MNEHHVDSRDLALLSRGDLPWWKALGARRHVERCAACRTEMDLLGKARQELRRELRTLEAVAGLDWDALEFEMRANIRVGLEAGEAIRPVMTAAGPLDWRGVVAVAALTMVVMTGWFLARNPARMPVASAQFGFARIEARQDGLELRRGQSALILTSGLPGGTSVQTAQFQPAHVKVDATGELTARSVDAETGQVTIRNVQVTFD
jgi:hypothetical protein